jgi:predicted MFS family arabinose efflux permease
MSSVTMPDPHANASVWRATLSGLSGSLVGIGLARFSYTPLLPAIIAAHWFPAAEAVYLGAANLAGYLGGALLAVPLASRWPAHVILRGMMLAATVAFFASAAPVDFVWFFAWRLVSGVAGGGIMVLGATTILAHVAPSRRGLVGGAIFVGIGFGIAASGTLVPLLLRQGLSAAWIGLGLLSLALTAVAWGGWPRQAVARGPHRVRRHAGSTAGLRRLYVQYGLAAFGLVPHMIFLVDYVARGRGEGLAAGAQYWVLFGLGAVVGPLLAGHVGDRVGFARTLRGSFLILAIAVAVPALAPGDAALVVSTVVVGAFTPGIVPIALGRIHELLEHHPAQHKAAWSKATTSFAVLQALSAYGMSFLFARTGGDYGLLFALGAGAMLVALVIDLLARPLSRP